MDRIIGIDYGKARIGVAISDWLGMMAHARATIPATSWDNAIAEIVQLARQEQVTFFVVGLPYNMDGSEGPAAASAKLFGEKLATASGLPVKYWDERMSTMFAQDILHSAGRKTKRSKPVIDQVAAQVILQSYMDANPLEE